MNFAKEVKGRYGETTSKLNEMKSASVQRISNGLRELKNGETTTFKQLNEIKSASVQRIQESASVQRARIHNGLRGLKNGDIVINRDTIAHSMETAKDWMKEATMPVYSAATTVAAYRPNDDTTILIAVFALSLLGSSLGFTSFLYFVSVGYGASIGIIAATALILSNVREDMICCS